MTEQVFPVNSDPFNESVLRPRAMTTLLPRAPWSTTVRPGIQRDSSVRFPIARRSIWAPVTAEMLIGTCCNGSSMRVAVTTTASSNVARRSVVAGNSTGAAPTATPATVTAPKPLRETVTV